MHALLYHLHHPAAMSVDPAAELLPAVGGKGFLRPPTRLPRRGLERVDPLRSGIGRIRLQAVEQQPDSSLRQAIQI